MQRGLGGAGTGARHLYLLAEAVPQRAGLPCAGLPSQGRPPAARLPPRWPASSRVTYGNRGLSRGEKGAFLGWAGQRAWDPLGLKETAQTPEGHPREHPALSPTYPTPGDLTPGSVTTDPARPGPSGPASTAEPLQSSPATRGQRENMLPGQSAQTVTQTSPCPV